MESTLFIPGVKTFVIPSVTSVLIWIDEHTNLPVFIPDQWLTDDAEDEPTQPLHYFYEASFREEAYAINVYAVDQPVPFNDIEAQLELNGPLSESQRVGSIHVEKANEQTQLDAIAIPDDASAFELAEGINAYQKNDFTSIWWQQKQWMFEYTGNSRYADRRLGEVALLWENIRTPEKGTVRITGGNRVEFAISWIDNGFLFSIRTGDDLEAIFQMMNEYTDWIDHL